MSERPFKFIGEARLECASLIIGWNEDVGEMGLGVTNYLKSKLKFRPLAEMEPTGFFPLGGVAVADDIAQFPEGNLYYCAEKELLLFQSDSPQSEWHKYLNTLIDIAQSLCRLDEIYTIGGMIALSTHTQPRQLMGVSNSAEMREILNRFSIEPNMNYETPVGQRPTLSSYLIWVARQRKIPGASIWIPVPFYLTSVKDPLAWRKVLEFFDRRFKLDLNYSDLDKKVAAQNDKLDRARVSNPELDEFIKRLENNQAPAQEENDKLVREIENILKESDEPE